MSILKKIQSRFALPAKIRINVQSCIGCGLCLEVCPYNLPQPDSMGTYRITDVLLCVECGACANNCPVQAIDLEERPGCGCIWCDDAKSDQDSSENDPSSCC